MDIGGKNLIQQYDVTPWMYLVANITQHLSVYDVFNFNCSSSRNHVGCTLTTMYPLEKYFWTGEMFAENVRRGGKCKSGLCVGVGVVASISQSLRRTAFDSYTSNTASVLNVFLFMILTFRSEPHQNKTNNHTQGHTSTPGLVYVQRWLQQQGLTYIVMKVSVVGLEA